MSSASENKTSNYVNGDLSLHNNVKFMPMTSRKPPTKTHANFPAIGFETTGINVPADVWALPKRVAFERAKERGGRPAVSALLVDLVQQNRKQLENELASASR